MNWYIAKIVFKIICGEGSHAAQYDEQLRLISAADQCDAFQKAICLGTKEQEAFTNAYKEQVIWQFVNVATIQELDGLKDGAEVYSCIVEPECERAYMDNLDLRAQSLADSSNLRLAIV